VSATRKYDAQAEGWSEQAYADSEAYLSHRAQLVASLGVPLQAGDRVVDLACGDAGLAEPLLARGLSYVGVDASTAMVTAARRRLGTRAEIIQADLNDYAPENPVAVTTCFRAIYYARDRVALLQRIFAYTERKVVFDLNPRQFRLEEVLSDLHAAGFDRVALRPFFVPQTVALPRPLAATLRAAERSGPLARLALRFRFTYLVAAFRNPNST
jgi:ubiquinone/menaquinone biosynthesis C-methylase UbiE